MDRCFRRSSSLGVASPKRRNKNNTPAARQRARSPAAGKNNNIRAESAARPRPRDAGLQPRDSRQARRPHRTRQRQRSISTINAMHRCRVRRRSRRSRRYPRRGSPGAAAAYPGGRRSRRSRPCRRASLAAARRRRRSGPEDGRASGARRSSTRVRLLDTHVTRDQPGRRTLDRRISARRHVSRWPSRLGSDCSSRLRSCGRSLNNNTRGRRGQAPIRPGAGDGARDTGNLREIEAVVPTLRLG
jgi:hypothetical protein